MLARLQTEQEKRKLTMVEVSPQNKDNDGRLNTANL
jgi:hypothetical protein